jgi:hypothetical protein
VRYPGGGASHVGTAELWDFQSYGSGCFISGTLTSNDVS